MILMSLTACKNASLYELMADSELLSLTEQVTLSEVTFTIDCTEGTLVWWTPDNEPEIRELTEAEIAGHSVTLEMPKNSMTPVLIYPSILCRDENAPEARLPVPRPIGCIWPVRSDLTASGGFSSRMLWRLLTETDSSSGTPEEIRNYCAHFNWKRFCEQIDGIENPWDLDQQKILLAIAEGTFTLNSLK